MFMTRLIIISFLFSITLSHSQENITYQKPSKEILDLVQVQVLLLKLTAATF